MSGPLLPDTHAWISQAPKPPAGGESRVEAGSANTPPAGVPIPRIVGLDLSMTSVGVSTADGTFAIASRADGDARLLEIRDRVYDAVVGADLAVVEDLPNHAKGAGITGRVQGVVRVLLLDAKVPYVLIVASSLKKYATGNGNADKVAMGVAAMKRFGLEFKTGDECDAFWLRAMALDALGHPLLAMPAVQRASLDKVSWPEIGSAS